MIIARISEIIQEYTNSIFGSKCASCVIFVAGQKEYVQGAGPGGTARCILGSLVLSEDSIAEYADKNQRGQGNIQGCV